MDLQMKPDWIGTPRVQGESFAVDFTLPNDDTRYKLLVDGTRFEIKPYGVKPGAAKPFLLDAIHVFEHQAPPLVQRILDDAYVRAVLAEHKR